MTPNIAPYLLEANRREPSLAIANTAYSCFELLQLTLALAGPEWSFVGKTSDMDGAKVVPNGFVGFDIELTRGDGQRQRVWIAGIGMDAAWHVPTRRQVKVIANSSANDDPDPSIHGPARLTPYLIEEKYYRWHNPPVRQERVPMFNRPAPIILGDATGPVTPLASAPAPAPTMFPYPDENTAVLAFQERVKAAYRAVHRQFPDSQDADAYRHFVRYGYSCRSMPEPEAANKHIRELRAQLGAGPE